MRKAIAGVFCALVALPAAALATEGKSPRALCLEQTVRTAGIISLDNGKSHIGVASPGATVDSAPTDMSSVLYRQHYSRLATMPNRQSCARLSDEPRPAKSRTRGSMKVTRGGVVRRG